MDRSSTEATSQDSAYLRILSDALAVCKQYKPKFGGNTGLELADFQRLYGSDPFYSWFGLDSPLMYATHKAAGGMTSIYRQIGIGAERLVKRIIMDALGLTLEQASWSYKITKSDQSERELSLDTRIPVSSVKADQRAIVSDWIKGACTTASVAPAVSSVVEGAVFEVRQGYKSKDSKRQNADIANAGEAYSQGYVPVLLLLSNQIDSTVAKRYTAARWVLLRGAVSGTSTDSTFIFCKEVIGYDLAAFFARNAEALKRETEAVLVALLEGAA